MRLISIILVCLVSFSCAKNAMDWKNPAIQTAANYALSRLDSATTYTDSIGAVLVRDTIMLRYVIHPDAVFRGLIDQTAKNTQILVSIDSLHDPYLMPVYHLVLEEQNDSLQIRYVIRSDMRVLEIKKDGIIVAEIPTREPSSPLYYCSECRDTVEYRLINGRISPSGN